MKKTQLLFALLLIISGVNAQQLLENGKLWYTGKLLWTPQSYTERFFRIDGDTVINNISYKTLKHTNDYFNPQWSRMDTFLREDTDNVVYMLDSSGEEGVLFDMGIQPGEEIVLHNGTVARYVDEKNVLFNSVWRREIKVDIGFEFSQDSFCWSRYFWIESVGGWTDLFPIKCDLSYNHSEVFTTLNCVTLGQELLYPHDATYCSFILTGTNQVQSLDLEVLPNPVDDVLTIRFDNDLDQGHYVQLINLQGQVLHEQKIHASSCMVDVSVFSSGIFILRVLADDGAFGFKKMVKL